MQQRTFRPARPGDTPAKKFGTRPWVRRLCYVSFNCPLCGERHKCGQYISLEAEDQGLDETYGNGGVCVVEWAEKADSIFPDDHLRVVFSVAGPDKRIVDLSAGGDKHKALLVKLKGVVDEDYSQDRES